jgi:hypothetical protein
VVPELAALAVYMQAVKFKSFEKSTEISHNIRTVSSLGENKATKLAGRTPADMIRFNSRTFTRIYPKGSRIDSSNLHPALFWSVGCQIVALNYQNFDRGMQLNRALFQQNAGCGYVLKPAYLRSPFPFNVVEKRPFTVSVCVISAAVLPKPKGGLKGEIIDPYVIVSVVTPQQNNVEEFRTAVVNDNGFNPRWHDLKELPSLTGAHTFSAAVTQPEVSFVRFVIKDHDPDRDDFIAAGCVPVSALSNGYRHVTLYDWTGTRLTNSRLLVYSKVGRQ